MNTNISETYESSRLYAGFIRRIFAFFIDTVILILINTLIVSIVMYIIQTFFNKVINVNSIDTIMIVPAVMFIVVFVFYFTLSEASEYRGSIGKRLLKIQVVDMAGNKLSVSKSIFRAVAKLISIFALFGYVLIPFTSKKQAIHDLIVGSLVFTEQKNISR